MQPVTAGDDRDAMPENDRMIVIQRNGKTTVVTGWRAWLLGAVAFAVTMVVLWLVFFVLLGVAITVGAVLLIAVPVVVGVALIASIFRGSPGR